MQNTLSKSLILKNKKDYPRKRKCVNHIALSGIMFCSLISNASCSNQELNFGPPEITEESFVSFEKYQIQNNEEPKTSTKALRKIVVSLDFKCEPPNNEKPETLICAKTTDSVSVNVIYHSAEKVMVLSKQFPSKITNTSMSLDKKPLDLVEVLPSDVDSADTSLSVQRQDALLNTTFTTIRNTLLSTLQENTYRVKQLYPLKN